MRRHPQPRPRLLALNGLLLVVVSQLLLAPAHAGDLRVHSSARGNGIRELRATGVIDAPPEVVFRVLCDVHLFRALVPHVKQFRVLERGEGTALAYQRLELPTLAPRDFTVRHTCHAETRADGSTLWVNQWHTDNGAGPPRDDGVVRLELNEGSWVLDTVEGGGRTRATYRLRIDPGGEVPAFIVNAAMEMQLPQLFDALERVSRRVLR